MIKNILFPAILFCAFGASMSANGQKGKESTGNQSRTELKFLDNISVDVPSTGSTEVSVQKANQDVQFTSKKSAPSTLASTVDIETASILQFKYSLLLDVEVEQIQNLNLFKVIDNWFGTRYKYGGTTKDGIDCSAFMQVLFSAIYGITLPRTAKDQYNLARRITKSELKEGDLVFFNTTGGISHVGMYLQNNKFVHASSSGVMVSDLDEEYYSRHFIGVGRIDQLQPVQSTVLISKP